MNYKILFKVDDNDVVISIAGLSRTVKLTDYLTSINFYTNMRDFYRGDHTVFEFIDVVSFDDHDDTIVIDSVVDFNYFACIEDILTPVKGKPRNVLSSTTKNHGNIMKTLVAIISDITTGIHQKTDWKFNILSIEICKVV